jgi:multidrug efflux pump subunit AcrA (membrane-fusion protein)
LFPSHDQRGTLKRELNTLEAELAQEELDRLQFLADEKQRIQDEADEAEALRKEEEAEAKAIAMEEADALKELENENMLNEIEDLRERALMEIEIEYQAELKKYENYANFAQIKGELDKKYTAAKQALDKKELKFSEITTKQKLNLAKGMFDDLANILGKESKAGKAAAIASTTISTFQGATSAFASLAPIPFVGPVLGGIAAAAAIVAGFKNIQAIRSGSTSTPSTPAPTSSSGAGSGAPDIPQIDEGTPAAEMMNGAFDLGNVGDEPDPVKAFVVTDEMTSSQAQLEDIRNRSTI